MREQVSNFYETLAQVSFTLLGLWFVVVQIREKDWRWNRPYRQVAYAVSLQFALPGVMSLFALVDPASAELWRISFAVAALLGVLGLSLIGRPLVPLNPALVRILIYWLPIIGYLAVALVGIWPGLTKEMGVRLAPLRVEELLLSLLILLAVGVAVWMLFPGIQDQRDQRANRR